MKSPLPAFYLAFVLREGEDTSEYSFVSENESQELRKLTGGYLLWKLKPAFPTLKGLDLKFPNIQEEDSRIVVEVRSAIFVDANDPMDKHDVFDKVIASLDPQYLTYIQKALTHKESPLLAAAEVQTIALEEEEEEDLSQSAKDPERVPIRASNVFVAFSMPLCEEEPSEEHYRLLTDATQRFYAGCIRERMENFREVKVTLRKALWKQGIPDDDHDVYVEWDIVATFAPFENTRTVPGKHWLYYLLVKVEMDRYFWKFVRKLDGTPFELATNMYIEQIAEEDQLRSLELMKKYSGDSV